MFYSPSLIYEFALVAFGFAIYIHPPNIRGVAFDEVDCCLLLCLLITLRCASFSDSVRASEFLELIR